MKTKTAIIVFTIYLISSLTFSFAQTPLKIVTVKPKGALKGIREADQITITFNTPVVQLQRIEEVKPDWLFIEPP